MNGRSRATFSRRALLGGIGAAVLLPACGGRAGPASTADPTPVDLRISAYTVPWDGGTGLISLATSASRLDSLSPVWFVPTDDGGVKRNSVQPTDRVEELARGAGLAIVPSISNARDGIWDGELVGRLVGDAALRARHIAVLTDLVDDNDWDGLDVDYENLSAGDRAAFTGFVEELHDSLAARSKSLSVTVQAKASDADTGPAAAHDYAGLGAAADELRVMAYDHSWSTSAPGAVAPLNWVNNVLVYATTHVPEDKIHLGLGSYGYDWANGFGTYLSWQEATALADARGAAVHWDSPAASPWFEFFDESAVHHVVWFEDVRSMQEKLALARSFGVAGVFLWQLGGEDPAIWDEALTG